MASVFGIVAIKSNNIKVKENSSMGKPKKQTSMRKTGLRRSHLVLKLARKVNGTSPVKVRTTKRETGKVTK